MLLTRKTDYALVALAGLARLGGVGASARDLAGQLHLPLPVLRNILKRLAAHGLLESSRGSSGGYRLARPPREITLAEVVGVIEGPVQLARCCPPAGGDDDAASCQLEESCMIKGNVQRIHERLLSFLDTVSLDQLLPETAPAEYLAVGGVRSTAPATEIDGAMTR